MKPTSEKLAVTVRPRPSTTRPASEPIAAPRVAFSNTFSVMFVLVKRGGDGVLSMTLTSNAAVELSAVLFTSRTTSCVQMRSCHIYSTCVS